MWFNEILFLLIAVEMFDLMLTEFQAIIKDREGSSVPTSNEYDDEEAIKKLLLQQRFSSTLSLLLRIPDVQSFKTGATTRAINALLTCHHPFIGMSYLIFHCPVAVLC